MKKLNITVSWIVLNQKKKKKKKKKNTKNFYKKTYKTQKNK